MQVGATVAKFPVQPPADPTLAWLSTFSWLTIDVVVPSPPEKPSDSDTSPLMNTALALPANNMAESPVIASKDFRRMAFAPLLI
jgi:hypothetical protein